MPKLLSTLALCLALAACGSPGRSLIELPAGQNRANVATLVIGLDSVTDSKWRQWRYAKADNSVSKQADDRVLTLPAARHFMLVEISASDTTRFGPEYFFEGSAHYFTYCAGQNLPAMAVKPGEVIYFGDVIVRDIKGKLALDYAQDFAQAKRFIARDYPDLLPRLKARPLQFYKVRGAC